MFKSKNQLYNPELQVKSILDKKSQFYFIVIKHIKIIFTPLDLSFYKSKIKHISVVVPLPMWLWQI